MLLKLSNPTELTTAAKMCYNSRIEADILYAEVQLDVEL